jgi:lipopolysaccharide biosynthesis glycosyltransferase
MKEAVVLICDRNFFAPSLGAAISARRHLHSEDSKVLIYVTDADSDWLARVVPAATSEDIEVHAADVPEIEAMGSVHRDRNLPPVTLARLWLHRLLPDTVERFLYIDGDVLVEDRLDALLANELCESKLLVASDTVALCDGEWGKTAKREKAYLDALGVSAGEYFNAGVILTGRRLWEGIAGEAVDYLTKHPKRCRSSDQSALNAVARGHTARLSQRWNYQSDHMMMLDPRRADIRPGIWHFTGGPKPWQGAGGNWPWDESFTWAYRAAHRRLRGLSLEEPVPTTKQLQSGLVHRARSKWRYKWIYPHRRMTREDKIRRELALGVGV